MIKFPKDFFWGAATSSYQVEGDNLNSDWWSWEKAAGLKDASARACRQYEFYKADFDLAQSLNHNVHRFSVEWSRIEPREGEFSRQEIDHYRDVVLSLRERRIEPVVTLHHFTNPLWFAKLGGWENRKARAYFLRYIEKIVTALSDNVRYWITINEPLVYVYHAYILGQWPPQKKSFLKAKIVENNLAISHIKAYRMIHGIYKHKSLPAPYVSIAKNVQEFVACQPTLRNKISVYLRNRLYNFSLIERFIRNRAIDFIGINYYTRGLVETDKWRLSNLLLDTCKRNHHPLKKNCLGWDIYPEGLYQLLLKLKKYNLPVFITENGICTDSDQERWDYVREHLKNVYLALDKGVKVIGYIYWSLIDNFEWDKGFQPRFGMIEVDYHTYKRTIRESAKKFSSVCKNGILD